jgi:methylmalonyl-CoA mutase cobalamin-binding subunit
MKTVVAAALGECVHVAGVMNFLRLAEQAGWRTVFLGPAVAIEDVLAAAQREQADLVGVSYRLTPETGAHLIGRFAEAADDLRSSGVRFAFAGTPPLAAQARTLGFFEQIFDGSESAERTLAYLKHKGDTATTMVGYPQYTVERIRWKAPFPLIRHDFGLPTMENTLAGVAQIAEARVLDVISLGIDQDALENFFRPERRDRTRAGADGVPVRSADDYRTLYAATRCGNYPLLRTYSGTSDFLQLAALYVGTINIAWCAIPLFWFSAMDGRGPRDLAGSIREHQQVMRWYAGRNIPVELNEPHHWGIRDAPDSVFVASAYLSAYNARACGVQDYIAQLMFNSPPGHSDAMDLAKMLAVLEMITPLAGPSFRIWKQTHTGLLSYPVDPLAARAQLVTSVYLQMTLRPDILHIVGDTEAQHAATADDVIEACQLAQRSVENALRGQPDMTADPLVRARVDQLVHETGLILDRICALAAPDVENPLTDADTLARAVAQGVLDAPQLRNNRFARGQIITRIIDGACVAVDSAGNRLDERERLAALSEAVPTRSAR